MYNVHPPGACKLYRQNIISKDQQLYDCSIPDFEFRLLNTVWNGNIGFWEWIGTGIFQGQRYGHHKVVEAKELEYQDVDVLILSGDNLIKEERAYYNMLDVVRQLQ